MTKLGSLDGLFESGHSRGKAHFVTLQFSSCSASLLCTPCTYAADPLCAPGADPSPTSIIELKAIVAEAKAAEAKVAEAKVAEAKAAEAKAAEAKATAEAAVGGVAGGADRDRAVWVADASAILQNAVKSLLIARPTPIEPLSFVAEHLRRGGSYDGPSRVDDGDKAYLASIKPRLEWAFSRVVSEAYTVRSPTNNTRESLADRLEALVALEELAMADEDDEDEKSSSQWEWNTSQWEFDPQRLAPDVTIDGEGSRVHFGMRTGTCLLLPKPEELSSSLSLPSSSSSSSRRLRPPSSVVLRLKLASRSYDAIDCDCVGMRRPSNRSLDKSFVDGSLGLDGEGGVALSACGALLVHTSVGLIDSPPMLEPFEQGDEILMHVRRSTRSLSIAKNGVEVARYAGVPDGWRFAVSSGMKGVWEIVYRPKWSRVLTPLDTRATPHALLRADYAEAEAMETKGSKSGAQTECAHFARTAPLTWVEMLEKSRTGHAKRMQQLAAYALRQAMHEQALQQARFEEYEKHFVQPATEEYENRSQAGQKTPTPAAARRPDESLALAQPAKPEAERARVSFGGAGDSPVAEVRLIIVHGDEDA